MARDSEPPPRFWTYGDVTVDANRVESVFVEVEGDEDRARCWIKLKMVSGRTYTLAHEGFIRWATDGFGSVRKKGYWYRSTAHPANSKAGDWAKKTKAKIMASLNGFLAS